MIRSLVLAAATLGPVQAAALTCAPPDPLQSFRMAHQAPEVYVVLHGALSFEPAPSPDGADLPPPGAAETALEPMEAQFEGFALGPEGFTLPFSTSVVLQPTCLGQFCGSIGPGEGWLLFAQPSGTGDYLVEVEPCGTWTFDETTPTQRDALAACLRGEACLYP